MHFKTHIHTFDTKLYCAKARHQAIIGELQEKLSLTEKELADAKTELLSLKESYSMEAKSKQVRKCSLVI